MKVHVGADVNSGVVHTVSVTPANASDLSQLPILLRKDDQAVFGDKGYENNTFKRAARAAGVFWGGSVEGSAEALLGRRPEGEESSARFGAQSGGTPVPGHEAPVWVPEGPLQRP
jgi:IS5 family transposase